MAHADDVFTQSIDGYAADGERYISFDDDAAIIRQMRKALDLLKEKYAEEAGAWIIVDFLSAAVDDSSEHWMRTVVKAEELSEPWLEG